MNVSSTTTERVILVQERLLRQKVSSFNKLAEWSNVTH